MKILVEHVFFYQSFSTKLTFLKCSSIWVDAQNCNLACVQSMCLYELLQVIASIVAIKFTEILDLILFGMLGLQEIKT